jgi:hypothetical protein
MIITLLRVILGGLPIALFIWYFVGHASFMETVQRADAYQGKNGVVELVPKEVGEETPGMYVAQAFTQWFPNSSAEWKMFFNKTGRDIDKFLIFIENYWLWMLIVLLLIAGIAICLLL